MAAIGDVDEANCAIGVFLARATLGHHAFGGMLAHIQNDLFDLGADLATPEGYRRRAAHHPAQVTWIEERDRPYQLGARAVDQLHASAGPRARPSSTSPAPSPRRAERAAQIAAGAGGLLAYLQLACRTCSLSPPAR